MQDFYHQLWPGPGLLAPLAEAEPGPLLFQQALPGLTEQGLRAV